MEDLKQYVRGRLPFDRLAQADIEQIVDELASHLADLRRDLRLSGASDEQIAAALDAELRDGSRTARVLSRLYAPPANSARARAASWRTLPLDAGQAARSLLRRPGVPVLAVLIMASAIGATTAVYSVVRAALLEPLPYPAADEIVRVGTAEEGGVSNVGYATFADWRRESHSFRSLALIRAWLPTLVAEGPPERLAGVRVSAEYFSTLAVRPALGRDFRADEDTPGGRYVVIISDALWRRRFSADPSAIGRTVQLDGTSYRIIGVMAPQFEPLIEQELYEAGDVWAPLGYDVSLPYACRTCRHLRAIGRLEAGVSVGDARAELGTIQARLRSQFPANYDEAPMAVVPFADIVRAPARPLLMVVFAAAALMLLVACANVSALLLVQATARRREIAVRAALGATRGRLAWQLFVESGIVALAAGALGVIVAYGLRDVLVGFAPAAIPRIGRAVIDVHVLGFAVGAAAASAVLAGTLPALRAAAPDLLPLLRTGGRGFAGRPGGRARRALVGAQLALTLVLLTGAGLMLRTLLELRRVDPGFEPADLITFQVSFVGPSYAEDARVEMLTNEMLDAFRRVPGVRAAASTSQFPLGGNMDQWGFFIEGRSTAPGEVPNVERYGVSTDYLRVTRIPLMSGRFFTRNDRRDGEQVVVVSEAAARRLWRGQDPIGARVKIGEPGGPVWRRVIGVVGDVHHYDLDSPAPMAVYTPNAQFTESFPVFAVRTAVEAERILPLLREAVWSVASDVPVYNVAHAHDIVGRATAPQRFATALLVVFAGIAMLLAGVGLYGVVAFTVAERTTEVGVRVAFGASRRDVVKVVARSAFVPLAAGLGAGVLASAVAAQSVRTLLFAVAPIDLTTYLAAIAFLFGIATAAHVGPLRRALSMDVASALRQE